MRVRGSRSAWRAPLMVATMPLIRCSHLHISPQLGRVGVGVGVRVGVGVAVRVRDRVRDRVRVRARVG